MNSSKDFEITADGELIAYHGQGGCVAIPEGVIFVARDGVFDPKLKITKLKLPSTLLGHKYEDGCEEAYVAYKPNDDYELKIDKYDSNVSSPLLDGQTLFSLLGLELPYLESYEVADANVIYHSVDGLLYFSGESFFDDEVPNFILDIPKAKEIPARLDCSYKEYLQRDRELRDLPGPPIVVEIDEEFLTRELISKAHNLGANHTRYNNLLIIHAPHAKSCDIERAYAYRMDYIKFVIVAPDMELVSRDSFIQCQAALGYIYKPEWYNNDQAERVKILLKVVESHAYTNSEYSGLSRAISYYHKLWDDKTVLIDEPKSDTHACIQLIDAVLYGTLDDVKRALSFDFDIYGNYFSENDDDFWVRCNGGVDAINVACRYGGVEKLTYLLEHEKFTTKSHGHDECIAQKFYCCSSYWPIFHHCFENISSYYYVVENGELRNLQPLPKRELFKCLEALVNHNTFCKETPGRLWFYAFMFGLDDLADRLFDAVDLDYFFYQAKDIGLRYDISSIFKYDIYKGAERTIELSKLMQSRGHELTLNKYVCFSNVYCKPDLAKKIFDNVTVAHWLKHYFVEFHIKCLCRKEMSLNHEIEDLTKVEEALLALLNSKRNGTAQLVKWCIEYAQEHGQTELVANLLNILNHKLGNNRLNFKSQDPLEL